MIRQDPELRHTPVVMVTGRADAEFVRRIASLGVDGYLVKPVTAAALLARIEHVARKTA
jgi:two-component system chemotaxis response regulator CheY